MFNMGVFSSQRPPEERARFGRALNALGYPFADAIIAAAEEDINSAGINQQNAGQSGGGSAAPASAQLAPEVAEPDMTALLTGIGGNGNA
jgi:hypothetical protein